MTRGPGWIQTYTGGQFWPLEPRAEDIDIEDIAHALSNTGRFGGHTLGYYSVAQHSVLVSHTCAPMDALWGLLHDAAEAYLGDMVRPLKHRLEMSEFRRAEHRLMLAVCQRFGLSEYEPPSVKKADSILLVTEKRDLLRRLQVDEVAWLHGAPNAEPLSTRIYPWSPIQAEQEFIGRYAELAHLDGGL